MYAVCVELPVAIGLQNAEQVTDDAFLPVNQLEGLSRSCAFCMGKALNEPDCVVSGGFVVMGILRHELRRCIIFQLSQVPHLHEKGGILPVAAFCVFIFCHVYKKQLELKAKLL